MQYTNLCLLVKLKKITFYSKTVQTFFIAIKTKTKENVKNKVLKLNLGIPEKSNRILKMCRRMIALYIILYSEGHHQSLRNHPHKGELKICPWILLL